MSIEIRGAEQLATLSKVLRQTGEKDLQKELNQATFRITKPVKDAIHRAADRLPSHGGLARKAAKSKLVTRKRSGQRIAGVRVVSADRRLSMWHLNQGQVRHRKGGNIRGGEVQRIPAGFADRAVEATAPQAQREYLGAMESIARRIGRR